MGDWRDALLKRFSFPAYERVGRSPIGWPGYAPAEVVRYGIGEIGGHRVVAAVWDFEQFGGSFGELDATVFVEATDRAAEFRESLVSFVRSGGVRLQEGMAALVGMPRAQLALRRLAAAGVPHIAVADNPTTGGVFVSVVTRADVRVAISGATLGFAGPRIAEVVTGEPLPATSHTAESAYAAGLVDAVVDPDDAGDWLARTLAAVEPREQPRLEGRYVEISFDADLVSAGDPAQPADSSAGKASRQVARARRSGRPGGAELLDRLLANGVELRADGGDDSVRAVVGGTPSGFAAVGVAVSAHPGGRPTPAGYRLAQRAIGLAGRLDRPLITLIDTPGAEPGVDAEAGGVAIAIADTMDAMLGCSAPTLAVVTGEGGSGGALAVAVADRIVVTRSGYFAALGPEAAAATLRSDPGATAGLLRLHPENLRALGFADVTSGDPESETFSDIVEAELAGLLDIERSERLTARTRRWSSPLPGSV